MQSHYFSNKCNLKIPSFLRQKLMLTFTYCFLQMVRVAWLFYFSKFIELLDTVRTFNLFFPTF